MKKCSIYSLYWGKLTIVKNTYGEHLIEKFLKMTPQFVLSSPETSATPSPTVAQALGFI
jgi:hypothetical protein